MNQSTIVVIVRAKFKRYDNFTTWFNLRVYRLGIKLLNQSSWAEYRADFWSDFWVFFTFFYILQNIRSLINGDHENVTVRGCWAVAAYMETRWKSYAIQMVHWNGGREISNISYSEQCVWDYFGIIVSTPIAVQ